MLSSDWLKIYMSKQGFRLIFVYGMREWVKDLILN